MLLLGISGGPDSMFLLNKYKKKKIVVAHVNYNVRLDSNIDQKIVKNFCQNNNITCEILLIKKISKGNFQNQAREIRYKFFQKTYEKYNCSKLLLAHHKDDFLETAIMQQSSGRTPRYFGIRKKKFLYNMNILRPFINIYWKKEILRYLEKYDIKFAIDSSNKKTIYKRNAIRKELNKIKFSEKNNQYNWFQIVNKILKKKFRKVDFWLKKWEKNNFSTIFFNNITKYKNEIIYEYINKKFKNANISTKKLNSIIQFIAGKDGNKIFLISNKQKILKNNNMLKTIEK